ncbi:MAG TPA: hypothetical protein VF730_00735, partial [Terracidiphilus sp.]
LLWQIASASGDSAEQAQIALTWNPVPEDLPHLAALLLRPGDADLTGRDLASIPYSLMRAYGDRAVPWLEKAVTDSPYLWVCVQSAVELARRNDSVAFRFILDAIESHRFYSAELIRDLKESFPTELDRNADDAAVIAFLKQRLAPK